MSNVVVIGSQWGDEGKGKIVDWLSERADVIVRFQGGHNAGHTLVIDGKVYKLSLLPSGIVRPNKFSIIGNGVVVDPWALLHEIETVRQQGVEVSSKNLMVSEKATLILPIHKQLDVVRERARGNKKIGTTGRGIGPAYEDKVARRAVRVCDLSDPNLLRERVEGLLQHHNPLMRGMGAEPHDPKTLIEKLEKIATAILPFAGVGWVRLDNALSKGEKILFEGAQGIMLDVDHGTYPFVTSSNTGPGQASTGSGIGPSALGYILGITKAYTTRVGSGPFPSEQQNEIGQKLGKRGHEFGVVTGRARRCGWFDAVLVKQAAKTSGMNGFALTKLDVLDGFETLKICTAYDIDGQTYDYYPASAYLQAKAKPIYITLPGWQKKTAGVRKWEDLPANAINYIRHIETLCATKVALLSTSPERADTILRTDPFS